MVQSASESGQRAAQYISTMIYKHAEVKGFMNEAKGCEQPKYKVDEMSECSFCQKVYNTRGDLIKHLNFFCYEKKKSLQHRAEHKLNSTAIQSDDENDEEEDEEELVMEKEDGEDDDDDDDDSDEEHDLDEASIPRRKSNYPKRKLNRRPRVIVIGAGTAGITAAMKLMNVKQCDVVVIEARDRLGGRIHTIDLSVPGDEEKVVKYIKVLFVCLSY